jgi:hypothetical protein
MRRSLWSWTARESSPGIWPPSTRSTRRIVVDGDCAIDIINVSYPGTNLVKVGSTCHGPGAVAFTTTGQLTSTCPYDGGTLQGLRLVLALDGAVFYNEELWPNPVVCYVTPAVAASTVWTAGTLKFINTLSRPSATTTFILADANWNYSAHTFSLPAGIACASNLVNIGTRFKAKYVEKGFKCSGKVAANSVATVTVH